ncbi:MAG: O-antigen ligase family protein [Elusimicrobia bacterium]|nr:O-antigen ligase family protein [Elusimicrobiota bacterium]
MKKPSFAATATSILGILLFVSPLLNASWDVWTKTIIHLLTVFFALFFLSYYLPEKSQNKTFSLAFVLFFWILLTSILSQITFNTELELHNWVNYLALFIMILALPKKYAEDSIKFVIAAISIIVIFGLYQYFIQKKSMPDSTMVNPNILAGYLVMIVPLLFSIQKQKINIRRGLIQLLLLSAVLCLILTKSLSGFVGLLSAVLIIKYRWRGLFISAAIFLFLLSFKLKEPDVVNRFLWWEACLRIIKDNPIFGTGLGTFQFVYPKYRTSALASIFAHNFYLQLCSEVGIPGLLILLALIYFSFKKINNTYIKISLLSILIQNIFEYNLYILANGILFWFLLAYGMKDSINEPKNSSQFSNKTLLNKALLVMPLLIYCNGFMRIYLSTRAYNLAENAYRDKDYNLSEEYLIKAKTIKPNIWMAYSKLSSIYLDKYEKTHYKSYLYEALTYSEKTSDYNTFYKYCYAKKTN